MQRNAHPYFSIPRLIAWIAVFVLFTILGIQQGRRDIPIYSDAMFVTRPTIHRKADCKL